MDEMKDLMDEYLDGIPSVSSGKIVKGKVLEISDTMGIVVDFGAKSEGIIPLEELEKIGQLKIGDEIDVLVKTFSGRDGYPVLSHIEAKKRILEDKVEEAFKNGETLEVKIIEKIKGGVKVRISDSEVEAFMPNSQIGYPPVKNIRLVIGQVVPAKVIKYDASKKDIVVSWRAVAEPQYKQKLEEFWQNARLGEIREGTVKSITDFGAFVDIGGFEGLLHIKDISWGRTEKVSDELEVGQRIKVKIINLNKTQNRVSLSLRETIPQPWETVDEKYKVGDIVEGTVKSLLPYGAFVELEPGLEGLLHISEISWFDTNKPEDILKTGDKVHVKILNINKENRRIALSLKEAGENPWVKFAEAHPEGSVVSGKIKNLTKNGAFVELENDLEGFIMIKDFVWERKIADPQEVVHLGEEIQAKVLKTIPSERRIYLGLKQMKPSPFANYPKGKIVKVTVTKIKPDRLYVELPDGLRGFIHISQIDSKKRDNLNDFNVGQQLEAVVIEANENTRQVEVSIKALEKKKEEATIKQYISTKPSGFSIGDILKKE